MTLQSVVLFPSLPGGHHGVPHLPQTTVLLFASHHLPFSEPHQRLGIRHASDILRYINHLLNLSTTSSTTVDLFTSHNLLNSQKKELDPDQTCSQYQSSATSSGCQQMLFLILILIAFKFTSEGSLTPVAQNLAGLFFFCVT